MLINPLSFFFVQSILLPPSKPPNAISVHFQPHLYYLSNLKSSQLYSGGAESAKRKQGGVEFPCGMQNAGSAVLG